MSTVVCVCVYTLQELKDHCRRRHRLYSNAT